jgi:hypothetical protein
MTETPVTPTIHLALNDRTAVACDLDASKIDDSGTDRATSNPAQVTCDACKTAGAAAAPVADPETLLRIARRVGMFHVRSANAVQDYKGIQRAAELAFAPIRRTGTTNQEILLPDGTKAGLISIETGGVDVTVDEDLLTGVIAGNDPRDFEDYVPVRALADPRLVALLAEFAPDLVERRVRPDIRARYQAELLENAGRVTDRNIGERVTVAVITPREATGKYSVTWTAKGRILLQEAVDAGLLAADGSVVRPAEPHDPAIDAEPQAAAAAVTAPPAATDDQQLDTDEDYSAAMVAEMQAERTAARRRQPGKPFAHPPTGEQENIVDAARAGGNLVIEAGAGAGKSSTLKLASAALAGHGYYLSFNKSVATEAAREFPGHVDCCTAHSLAMSAVGRPYSHRLNGPRIPARETAKILGITGPLRADENRVLAPAQVARLVMETVGRFTHSADETISAVHVPRQSGLDSDDAMSVLRQALPPLARKAWADLVSTDGKLRFDHDVYLKLYQLSHPQLSADFIFLDEAQDSDAVVLDIVTSQRSAQLIAVGDRAQQIYEWRGAVDAMDKFPGAARLTLSQSFRFGSAIAGEANKWLGILGTGLRLTGNPRRSSMITALPQSHAVLCRTNGGALEQAMRVIDAGRKAAIVGGGRQIRALAEAAETLKAGRPTSHPELWAFKTWGEVQDYVQNDAGGGDLRVMVQLIDDKGPDVIKGICDQLADEKDADTVVSTVHKAKGLEWDSVRIAGDFREPRKNPERPDEEPEIPAADARLAYVAVTRARLSLDPAGVAYVNKYLGGAR